EDIDRAIALSLSGGNSRASYISILAEKEAQVEEDELLARALQESMISYGAPQVPGNRQNTWKLLSCFFFSCPVFRICAGCNSELRLERYLNCMNSVWHPDCFKCYSCRLPIREKEFSKYGNYPFHKLCYKEAHHSKCDVCHQFIPVNGNGYIEYKSHPFWSQKYCPSHERDKTSKCCSCERMESSEARYVPLNDGRSLCFECLDSAFMDTGECQPLYLEIQAFYEALNMKVNRKIPLLLVERQTLNKAMDTERARHDKNMPEVRGICLAEEQTVKTVKRIKTEDYRLKRECEVTAILVLYGLPRLLTGWIIAHEMMHAWMKLSGYRNVRPEVEEGMCQVMARMWLESQSLNISMSETMNRAAESSFEKKLCEFFKHAIATDSSQVYGQGFRDSNEAVDKFGLQRTLDKIKATGTLP
ncbi:hypothetical protein M569_09038, partial [Genlisea aurea]